jgi:hypothetical protein
MPKTRSYQIPVQGEVEREGGKRDGRWKEMEMVMMMERKGER